MPKFADTRPGTYDRTTAGKAHQRMLGAAKWKRYSKAFLAKHPLCECPHHRGRDAAWPAHLVDHKRRPGGDPKLFWDRSNHMAMNRSCHAGPKQSEEAGGAGFNKGCDAHGWPLSQEHSWHHPNRPQKDST